MASNGEHGRAVKFCVIKSVEQMNAPRAGSSEAHSKLAGVFGVTAGHKSRSLLVAHLDETNLVLGLAQRLDDSVDAVARQTENDFNAPFLKHFDQNIRRSSRHKSICFEILCGFNNLEENIAD